jgi:hypothetical protein
MQEDLNDLLEGTIFPSIHRENCVLFLGAGSSYTSERNYLGSTIIDYYEDYLGKNLDTRDLVEFVDRASSQPSFSRSHFDQYVKGLLDKLNPEPFHEKIVSLGWRQIFTTNMDLLLEKSYEKIKNTSEEFKELVPCRNLSEYHSTISQDELKYIKLNGCLSDLSQYPLVFSSKDFNNQKSFYKTSLANLSSFSPKVIFLSIGYSFTDGLADKLLTEINKNSPKDDRIIFNIDPFPNEDLIPYLKEKNVITINLTVQDFFEKYTDWENEHFDRIGRQLPRTYFKANNQPVNINTKLQLRLSNKIKQLHQRTIVKEHNPVKFYTGQEPNYSIILGNHDILKDSINEKIVQSVLRSKFEQNYIPVNFIVGESGIGKSTSAYRAIEILQNNHNYTCFLIIDLVGVRGQDLEELFDLGSHQNIVLMMDDIERNTSYKSLMNFRRQLSEYQFNRNVSFLAPIRENIYDRYRKDYSYMNVHKISVNHKLNDSEIDKLITKLEKWNLIELRDALEKDTLRSRIKSEFASDQYVAMMALVNGNTLIKSISDTFKHINDKAKLAFEFTSLVYQFKIPMPASVLKKVLNMEWKVFMTDVLQVDCKGLLINEVTSSFDVNDDLVFRTKHSLISRKFIESVYRNENKLFKSYVKIIRFLNSSDEHAKLVIDLFKVFKKQVFFKDRNKLDKLYDEAGSVFLYHPNFNLHYAMNLQGRRDLQSLLKADERLMQVASNSERRIHHVTHRRAVISFKIAQAYNKSNDDFSRDLFISKATDFFEIKLLSDPFSSYSYVDFIGFEMWKAKEVYTDEEDILSSHIRIQDLMIRAYESVYENSDLLTRLKSKYIRELELHQFSKGEILKNLEELYDNSENRPYALIFKLNSLENEIFNFVDSFLKESTSEDIVNELLDYYHLAAVREAIFDYHSRRLCWIDSRMALSRFDEEELPAYSHFKYHYYNYIKESYNYQYKDSYFHLSELKKRYRFMNPAIQELWIDSESNNPKRFKATFRNNKTFKMFVHELGREFKAIKPNFSLIVGQDYYCHLDFTVRGIRIIVKGAI